MKIGLDVSQTCVEIAGCGWIAHELAKVMTAFANPDRELILYHHFGSWINTHTKSGFKSDNKYVHSPLLKTSPDWARLIWHNIENGESELPGAPDIVHSHNFSSPDTGKTPLVLTVHDLAFWDLPETTTETNRLICQDGILQALENADAFVFPSRFTQSRFLDFFEDSLVKNNQFHAVIPWAGRFPSVDQPKSFSLQAPWLFVGSLDPRKNIHNMLQAFEKYWEKSNQHRNLLIAGPNGWKSDDEVAHIKSLTRRGWAKHLGYLEDETLMKLYRDAFALVWPSHYEGFGLPVVESMSQGTPVITSHQTSLAEVGGAAAIYCDPDSIESIAEAMLRFEENEAHYSVLSKDSLQQAEKFSWEKTALDLLDFYKKILSSH